MEVALDPDGIEQLEKIGVQRPENLPGFWHRAMMDDDSELLEFQHSRVRTSRQGQLRHDEARPLGELDGETLDLTEGQKYVDSCILFETKRERRGLATIWSAP